MKRWIDTAIAAVFLAVPVGFAAAFWLVPDKAFSENENRVLQTLPAPSLSSWLEGTLSMRLSDYYTDQIPLRTELVGLSSGAQVATGRGEANGVLWNGGDKLAVRRFDAYLDRTSRQKGTDLFDPTHVKASLTAIGTLDEISDTPVTLLIAPRVIDVTGRDFGYPTTLSDTLHKAILDSTATDDIDTVDLFDKFSTMH